MVKYFRENPENISPTSIVVGLSDEVKVSQVKQQVSDAVDLVSVASAQLVCSTVLFLVMRAKL
jgi:hypothetical protein